MQLAVVTSEIGNNGGGLSFSCLSFCELLESIGANVTVISSVYGQPGIRSESGGFAAINNKTLISEGGYRKDLKGLLFFRAHLKNVLSEVKSSEFDFIIAFGAGYNGLFATEISKKTGAALIVLPRGSEVNLSVADASLHYYNHSCLRQAMAVISLSNELSEAARAIYYDSGKLYEVIPNIIRSADLLQIPETHKDKIVLGCGSKNLNEKKGISNLIAMLYHLNRKSGKQFCFEFAGHVDSDLLDNLRNLCSSLQVEDKVTFLGNLTRTEFTRRIKTWDFYIQGSFCEGFSNSMGDCLAQGKAFLLSNSGYIAEAIRECADGLVFDDFVPENMADKLLNLIGNENTHKLYKTAYRRIGESCSRERILSQWISLFEQLKYRKKKSQLPPRSIISIVFHDISESTNSNIDTDAKAFSSFVKGIHEKGYRLCSSLEYFSSSDKSNLIVCTFDDAYEGVYKLALPVLAEFGFTATIFVCTDYIGKENDWNFKDTRRRRHLPMEELTVLKKNGWEIGSHGKTHRSLLKLSHSELIDELVSSRSILENHFGTVCSYAYPYGDFNDFIKGIVSKTYANAFALSKGGNLNGIDNCQIRRYFISEISEILEQ